MTADGRSLWGLKGWRLGAFAALAAYVVAVGVFLVAGGASPRAPGMSGDMADASEQMLTDVAGDGSGGDGATTVATTAGDSAQGSTGDTPDEPAPAPTTEPAPVACNEVDLTELPDSLDGLGGVHRFVYTTLDDQPASLAALAGCPMVVNFFASWCAPCVREMPEFDEFWQAYGSQVAMVGLAVEDAEPARKIVEETGVTYPTGVADTDAFMDFGGVAMPTTVFIDEEGTIVRPHSGVLDLASLKAMTEEHLGVDLDAGAAAGGTT